MVGGLFHGNYPGGTGLHVGGGVRAASPALARPADDRAAMFTIDPTPGRPRARVQAPPVRSRTAPKLQAVLNVLRGSLHCQNLLLVVHAAPRRVDAAPRSSRTACRRGSSRSCTFDSLEAAEWHAFRDALGSGHRPGVSRSIARERPPHGASSVLGYADPAQRRRRARRSGSWSAPSTVPAAIARRWSASSAATPARRPRPQDRSALPTPIDGEHEGAPSSTDAGSYAIVERPEAFGGLARFTLQAFIQPTRVPHPARAEPAGHHGHLGRGSRQRLRAPARRDGRARAARAARALACPSSPRARRSRHGAGITSRRRWISRRGRCRCARRRSPTTRPSLERPVAVTAPRPRGGAAGRRALPRRRAPRRRGWPTPDVLALQRQDRPPDALAPRADAGGRCEAAATARSTARRRPRTRSAIWDLAADIATDRVTDRSPNHLHGRTVNAPKRAVTGHNWDGSEMDWRRAPAAVRRHPLSRRRPPRRRAGGPEPHHDRPRRRAQRRLRAPSRGGRRPGVLGGVLRAPAAPRAARRAWRSSPPPPPTSPTRTTGRACGRGQAELFIGALPIVDPTDLLLMHHPELGGSTYDTHSDGSGRLPCLAAAPDREHAADRAALEPLPRPLPARLARGRRSSLRRHHRRRSPRRGRAHSSRATRSS